MPSIITHLACAERYFRDNQVEDFNKFILGTIFPDIRYLAKIERNATHKRFNFDLDFSGLSSFEAGWKLHIFVDGRWNQLAGGLNFYNKYEDKILASTAAKIIEDRLDYKFLENMDRFIKALDWPDLPITLGIAPEKIKFYYLIASDYIVTKNYETFALHLLGQQVAKEVLEQIVLMDNDQELLKSLSGLVEKILP